MNRKKTILAAAAISVLLLLMGSSQVSAAARNVKQTGATEKSVTVSWEGTGANTRYFASTSPNGMYTDITARVKKKAGNSAVITGLSEGNTYYIRIRSGISVSRPCETVTKPAGLVGLCVQTGATEDSISLRFSMVTHATGFRVTAESGNGHTTIKKTKTCQATLTGLDKNSAFKITVTPYRESASYTAYGNAYDAGIFSVVPSKPTKVTFTKNRLSRHKASFSWKSCAKASGYQYQILTYDKKTVTEGTTKKKKITVKKKSLTQDSFYQFRVRPYISVESGKAYGKWSAALLFCGGPRGIVLEQDDGLLSVRWKKVKGATSYTVYVSASMPKKLSKMKKVKTTKSLKLSLSSFQGERIRYEKVYYVAVTANRKAGKKIYRSKPDTFYHIE